MSTHDNCCEKCWATGRTRHDIEEGGYMETTLSIREFKESGLLQEVNRLFFHPRGMALTIEAPMDLTKEDGWKLAHIQVTDDPEGFMFTDLEQGSGMTASLMLAERLYPRMKMFGVSSTYQPLEPLDVEEPE